MEPFSYTNLSSIMNFGVAKMKMDEYLGLAARTLEAELAGVKMEGKLDFEDQEYVIEHLTDAVEIRYGFIWGHNEIHIAFELSLGRKRGINDHWVKSYDIYYKCIKLTELMNGYNGLEEEFAISEFIESGCKQIVTILNIPTL